jgi:Dna[CI] antecedent DciA-like protein
MTRRGNQDGERRGGVHPAGQAVREFLRASGLGAKLRDYPVYEAWRKALGDELGRRARAVDFRRGELIVEVESAAHLHEFANFTGERYRQLTNQHLGREAVTRVSFKLKR